MNDATFHTALKMTYEEESGKTMDLLITGWVLAALIALTPICFTVWVICDLHGKKNASRCLLAIMLFFYIIMYSLGVVHF